MDDDMTGLEKEDRKMLEMAYNTAKGLFEKRKYGEAYSAIDNVLSAKHLRRLGCKGEHPGKYRAMLIISHATGLMSEQIDYGPDYLFRMNTENGMLLKAMELISSLPEGGVPEEELKTLANYVKIAVGIAKEETLKRNPDDRLFASFNEFSERVGDYIEGDDIGENYGDMREQELDEGVS